MDILFCSRSHVGSSRWFRSMGVYCHDPRDDRALPRFQSGFA